MGKLWKDYELKKANKACGRKYREYSVTEWNLPVKKQLGR